MGRKIENSNTRRKRNVKPLILIAAEGGVNNKTEKNYFYNFRSDAYNIEFVKGDDTDPSRLVTLLQKKIEEIGNAYVEKAYCVFDTDTEKKKNRNIEEARKLVNKSKYNIELIISTPSFELWFLLHFKLINTAISTNEELIIKLKVCYPNYRKNCNIYDDIKDKTDIAIKNAKRLEKFQIDSGNKIGTIEANPNTEVYKVVEYLLNKQ